MCIIDQHRSTKERCWCKSMTVNAVKEYGSTFSVKLCFNCGQSLGSAISKLVTQSFSKSSQRKLNCEFTSVTLVLPVVLHVDERMFKVTTL